MSSDTMTDWPKSIKVLRCRGCLRAGFLCLWIVAGCRSEATRGVMLEGYVNFNGEPIADGTISLLPLGDTPGPSVMGIIHNGKYAISQSDGPTVGSYRVEIEGFRKTGRQIPDMASPLRPGQQRGTMDEKRPYIPEKFNVSSVLTTKITTETKELNFDLQS
jgi:hypothetical protein